MRLNFIIAALVYMHVSGCATTPAPYLEIGVGYQIDSLTHEYRRTSAPWECSDNFKGVIELGLDYGNTRIGYHHQSWITCGLPAGNHKNETWSDDIRLTHRFGGKK